MTKDEVVRAAQAAGFFPLTEHGIECVRKLIMAEREACAVIVDRQDVDPAFKGRIAEAIRTRGAQC